ncbi:MAG: DNA-deoxyinosine glycosylase [Ectothiorhodospiraceae bacterium]|jgi:hypoxanthine-DNA glycosylase|nr:DNA-deoxyinosine glycosylase [Ectothiorhodospiraceae bacterium]
MSKVQGFPPIDNPRARVLVLGTMPSPASLRANQYYGHPQNLFWPIAGRVLGFDPALSYEQRVARVRKAGVAIWDVLQTCVRPGALDSAIDDASVVANDFASFFAAHPRLQRVIFNGAKAEQLFHRHVLPGLKTPPPVEWLRLPSTSPANASIRLEAKLLAWQALIV